MKREHKDRPKILSDVNGHGKPWQVPPVMQDRLRGLVRMYYDMQGFRIAAGNRIGPVAPENEPYLDDDARAVLDKLAGDFRKLEAAVVRVVTSVLRDVPIARWLQAHDGVGPCMAGVLLSEISLIPNEKYPDPFSTVSKLWAFTGLHTSDGQSVRRRRGEKAGFNPWLRAKVTAVLARNLIKTNTRAEPDDDRLAEINAKRAEDGMDPVTLDDWREAIVEDGFARRIAHPWMQRAVYVRGPWAPVYYDYRHRLESRVLATCAGCEGKGKRTDPTGTADEKRAAKAVKCWNCDGTGGPAPWGRGADHRDQASVRYLAKMFLAAFINEYRREEGLVVRPPYSEEKLGHAPHGAGVQRRAVAPGYTEAYMDDGVAE